MNKQKMTASQQDGVQYRRAKTWQIALSQLFGAAQMCFYMVMTYAAYIGNAGYGIVVGVTGIIITASRLVDGVTGPVCAYIVERSSPDSARFALSCRQAGLSCRWPPRPCAPGAPGISAASPAWCFSSSVIWSTSLAAPCPASPVPWLARSSPTTPGSAHTVSVWNTIYSYIGPMVISMISMAVLLPRFDNQVSIPFLSAFNLVAVALSLVMYLISCIGITPYDKPEYFAGVKTTQSDGGEAQF